MPSEYRIGCAGWRIPKQSAQAFPQTGSHLERYAARFGAVEINSSFYRPHLRATYERWAASVPDNFAFAVKAPKAITHQRRLVAAEAALEAYLARVSGLGPKLGALLFQLPPSLAHEAQVAAAFWAALRARFDGNAVCEPRHPSWFTDDADALMTEYRIGRVAADPPRPDGTAEPGGWQGVRYLRLHGSPRPYYSAYGAEELERFARQLTVAGGGADAAWCIFDNTAAGAAATDALALQERLTALRPARPSRDR